MPLVEIESLHYAYPLREGDAPLRGLSLTIEAGELLLVMGESGSGKSTLLRALNGLVPHFYGGQFGGRVRVNGLDTRHVAPRDLSAHVGFVFQDPEAQFVAEWVEDELVFAMENFGLPPATMQARVEEVVAQLDIAPLRHRRLATLSGGEKQRVAIASVLTLHPALLVLDEPTSQLDPEAAEEVLAALQRLNATLGLTIVLAEHRLERVLPHVSRVLWLPGDGSPPRVGPARELLRHSPLVPPVVALGRQLGWEPLPLTVEEAGPQARASLRAAPPVPAPKPASAARPANRAAALRVEQLAFAYQGRTVLRELSLTVGMGEFVALMGRNGSGKSTLLKLLVGLLQPDAGRIELAGRAMEGRSVQEHAQGIGYLPQNPNALLFAETVYEEPLVTLRNHGLSEAEAPFEPRALLARLGLAHVAAQYPRDLSAGQRERVALAALLVMRPPLLLLDEPTRGLDYAQKRALMGLLQGWQADGTTVIVVSHDVELVAEYAERVVMLADGQVGADGPTAEVLGRSPTFAPQMSRLFERPELLTVADALRLLGRGH